MSKYDLFRRRIAPVAFGLAIVLMARESCHKQEQEHATFVLDLGAAQGKASAVNAELVVKGDVVGVFHRAALDDGSMGKVKFEAVLPAEDAELRIDVDLPDGPHHLVRSVHAADGATVVVPLGDELK